MASLTRWTWVWVNSGSWWWTGRPAVLRFMGYQIVGHNWATELNWSIYMHVCIYIYMYMHVFIHLFHSLLELTLSLYWPQLFLLLVCICLKLYFLSFSFALLESYSHWSSCSYFFSIASHLFALYFNLCYMHNSYFTWTFVWILTPVLFKNIISCLFWEYFLYKLYL